MKKENKNFRRGKNNKKKEEPTLNLGIGIKVGDWFEDISGSELGLKDFYMVKSLNQTRVKLVEIGLDDGELSEVLCGDYEIKNFKKVKDILEYDHLKLKKIGEDEARNRLKKVDGVSLILECFGVNQKKVSPQNPPSTQSTIPENKPTTDSPSKKRIEKPKEKEDLNLKVGDWLRGTERTTCGDIESIYFVSKIETDSIFLENARPRNITFDQSIESEPWNRENFYKRGDIIYFESEYVSREFKKISKDEVLDTLRSWSTTIDWTFKRLISDTQYNKKLMTIENFLEKGIDFSGKCIIVKPLTSGVAACIKVNRAKRGDKVYMNVAHSTVVFYPEVAFEIPIDSKNSCHCRTEKDIMAGKELLYDTHSLIEVISEEEFMTLRNEANNQNSSSIQSTTPENEPKTAKDLGIKVGDWFEIPQIYAESKDKVRRFLRVEKVTDLNIEFKEVNVEPTNPDVDHTIEVDKRPWLIKYFHKNADGTFFWETERDGRLDFERRDIDVVRKEVTRCLNLGVEDELRDLNLLETKPEEKLKKSKYLKYVKDNEVYYLHDPKYETKNILEQEKFCVIASGITIINNRINHHSCNDNKLNLIRLMFDNEKEFFNKVTEISEYEYHTLWHDLI